MHIKEEAMPRPCKPRCCRLFQGDPVFKPRGIPMRDLAVVHLRLDELEALRLCDLEGHTQQQAAERMGVSRGTVQRLLEGGRSRVVSALVTSSALVIDQETASPRSTR